LLSIKPKFAHKIFDGSKLYEFRKALFKKTGIKKVIVYASSPVQKVIGEFEIEEILSSHPNHIWEQTQDFSGIEKDFFDEYFNGREIAHAIKIKTTTLYEEPLSLIDNFQIKYPPQSFAYVNLAI